MEEYKEEQVLGTRSKRNKEAKLSKTKKVSDNSGKVEKNKTKKEKKPINKKRRCLIFFIILNIIAICVVLFLKKVEENGGGLSGTLATIMGHNDKTLAGLERIDVLIIGVSTDLGAKLSDTIMIASYDPKLQKASLLSIPRDTFVGTYKSQATPNDKINAIYSYTEDGEKVLDAVNSLLGLNIENYVVVETDMLVEIVDEVGGIEFDVPINMYYTSTNQGLYINLSKGVQVLSGQQAEWLLRFRQNNDGSTYSSEYGNGDTGRMRTQREFLMAVIEQVAVPSNITKIGSLVDIVESNFSTNLNFSKIKDYIPYTVDFDVNNIFTEDLPGQNEYCNGTWIFVPDYGAIAETVDYMFNFKDTGLLTNQIAEAKIEIMVESGNEDNAQDIKAKLVEAGYTVELISLETTISTMSMVKTDGISYELTKDIKTIINAEDITVVDDQTSNNVDGAKVVQILWK